MIRIAIVFLSAALISVSSFSQSAYRNIMISDENEPDETSIVINPNNTNHIVVAANIENYYFSFDGGYTWASRKVSSQYGVWGDPCLVMDTKENIYYFHLALAGGFSYDRIVCQKSNNGGINWTALDSFVGLNPPHMQDKEWASVDVTNSPYKDNVYVFWTQCGQGGADEFGTGDPAPGMHTDIFFASSTDEGESWKRPQIVSKEAGSACSDVENTLLGANTCVGPNGELYVCWSSGKGIIFTRSTDGGDTWLEKNITIDSLPAGFKYYVSGIYRCFGFATIACDRSNGPNRGKLYVSWTDQRKGEDDAEIWFTSSTDMGSTWTSPVTVNSSAPKTDQFVSSMALDQSNGKLYFVYYDRSDFGGLRTEVYLGRSDNGGKSFTNEKISESAFTPNQSTFFGDYICISAVDGVVRPVWTRLDDSKLSIWTAIINE